MYQTLKTSLNTQHIKDEKKNDARFHDGNALIMFVLKKFKIKGAALKIDFLWAA